MGICTSNKSNRVHNQNNHHEIDYKPFIFDTSIVPE